MSTDYRIKRIYEKASKSDGCRVLIDRLWPRGIAKEKAEIDLWAKDLAPSTELRKWLHEDISRYDEFVVKYLRELNKNRLVIRKILGSLAHPTVTLLTSVKEIDRSHAAVLKTFLEGLS